MWMAQERKILGAMAMFLNYAPSTISKVWRRHAGPNATPGIWGYDAMCALIFTHTHVRSPAMEREAQPVHLLLGA